MPSTKFLNYILEKGGRMFGATLDGDQLKHEMQVNKQHFLEIPYETVKTKSCGTVLMYQYYVETSNSIQQIITLGEHHRTQVQQGTFTRILEDLVGNTSCPIDVFVEESFHPYQEKTLFKRSSRPFGGKSLLSQFLRKHPDATTSKQQQQSLTTIPGYTQKYIQPYMGKMKFWNIDLRVMFWFPLLTMDNLFNNQTRKEMLELVFDVRKYRSDPQGYDIAVHNKLKQILHLDLYEKIIKTKAITGHNEIMKKLDQYDINVAVNLCRFARHDSGRDIIGVMDFYHYLRLAKLVRQDKNRIIICLSGFNHTDALFWFMRLNQGSLSFHENSNDFIVSPMDGMFTINKCHDIVVKNVPISQKTKRMQLFQAKHLSIEKNKSQS